MRDSCVIGRYDGSIVAHPNGISDGSRIAVRIFVYASLTETRDGFWQGRELPELQPLHPPEDEREWLSPEENARRLRELTATLTQKP